MALTRDAHFSTYEGRPPPGTRTVIEGLGGSRARYAAYFTRNALLACVRYYAVRRWAPRVAQACVQLLYYRQNFCRAISRACRPLERAAPGALGRQARGVRPGASLEYRDSRLLFSQMGSPGNPGVLFGLGAHCRH